MNKQKALHKVFKEARIETINTVMRKPAKELLDALIPMAARSIDAIYDKAIPLYEVYVLGLKLTQGNKTYFYKEEAEELVLLWLAGFLSDCCSKLLDAELIKHQNDPDYGRELEIYNDEIWAIRHKPTAYLGNVRHQSVHQLMIEEPQQEILKAQALNLYRLMMAQQMIQYVRWHGYVRDVLYYGRS